MSLLIKGMHLPFNLPPVYALFLIIVSNIYQKNMTIFILYYWQDHIRCADDNFQNINFLFQVFVMVLTWILAIIQPYGLRFRSYVMGYYHPDIARTRAIWLHNRVIRRRINFVTFARRFLRRKFGLSGGVLSTDPSCLDFIYSKSVFEY